MTINMITEKSCHILIDRYLDRKPQGGGILSRLSDFAAGKCGKAIKRISCVTVTTVYLKLLKEILYFKLKIQ